MRIGTSGWVYAPWHGDFYPPDLRRGGELAHLSGRMNSAEINASFYSLQRPRHFRAWAAATPADFVFAVKGSRYITHLKKLRGVETALANFLASGVLALGPKLGPLLWQLPPSLRFDADRMAEFFALLPRTTGRAADLAARHDERVTEHALPRGGRSRPVRHAVEVRHPSFATPEAVALFREHGIALVVADTAGHWPYLEDITAEHVYVRLHGDEELYTSGYTAEALDRWAWLIDAWRRGESPRTERTAAEPAPPSGPREVFVYFDNTAAGRAPHDAMALARRLQALSAP
ncbi:DUF72 domain-containing protein [Saccharopolyspora sp. CA-218241]|uniref:DUF72 domain-containing protein n=1 Tax=Saccharopolyspora sp. CA-218241 TaxID=3240027 RepID=UPI003D96FC12